MRKKRIDLAQTIGPEWAEVFFGADGLLYLPGWRRGFTASELRQQFLLTQERFFWMHEAQRLGKELERRDAEIEEVEKRATFYRSQLRLESTLGMMLARVKN